MKISIHISKGKVSAYVSSIRILPKMQEGLGASLLGFLFSNINKKGLFYKEGKQLFDSSIVFAAYSKKTDGFDACSIDIVPKESELLVIYSNGMIGIEEHGNGDLVCFNLEDINKIYEIIHKELDNPNSDLNKALKGDLPWLKTQYAEYLEIELTNENK